MLSILSRWNRWGTARLPAGIVRDATQKIYPVVNTPEIVVLIGMRRSGKTTILFQVMDYLESQKIPQEAMLHINFEEPALASALSLDALDQIYHEYREKIFPTGKAYLFFDEIQNVPQWERWVRARNESENIKIFLTGSSANLMSRELGTVLTGRHVSFHIHPLNFSEFLKFKKISVPKNTVIEPPHEIYHAVENYLLWGGLPEIVLSQSNERRELLLKQYFDDLLFKDVAMRHEIRDIALLRNLAVYLMTQTASLVSYNRIANQFGISIEKSRSYCACLQEAFLVEYLPFFSLKTAERNRHPFKVHAVDLGLRNVVALSCSEDKGRLIETAVCHHLKTKYQTDLYYWKSEQEIDFLRYQKNEVVELVQVVLRGDSEMTLHRELSALSSAKKCFPKASESIVLGKLPKNPNKLMVALWRFLLS